MRSPRASQKAPLARGDDGFALAAAVIVMFIAGLLVAVAVSTATFTASSGTRDEQSRSAFEAAEAALRTATYRINMKGPGSSECLAGTAVQAAGSDHYCTGEAEHLSNGTTFRYWTSQVLEDGARCAGQTIEAAGGGTVQRCVTAEGVVKGVKERMQERIASSGGSSKLFPVAGILGLEEVEVSGSVSAVGVVASNGLIHGEGSAAFTRGYELGPAGTFEPSAERVCKEVKQGKKTVLSCEESPRVKSGVTVCGNKSTPMPECEAKLSEPFVAALPTNHATESANEDARLENGEDEFFKGWTTENNFNPANHELSLSANGRLTLGGARYYLCNFKATSNSELIIAADAKVEIFVDSPEDPNGKCPAGSGKFESEGDFHFKNLSGKASSLLIMMYGKGPFKLLNGAELQASLFAPQAEIVMNGGTKFTGGIVGNKVFLDNGLQMFQWASEDEELEVGNPGSSIYYRTGWTQCSSEGQTPTEGC